MAEKTKFQYAKSPTGALSGASFIQQTEDAINDIGGKLVEYNAISEETKRKAEQAISTSETALNTANQALTQSAQAIETANTAKAQSDSAVAESRAAKEAAEAAKLDAEESARDAESSWQAAEDANESAQAAAQRAQTAQDTAETAQENAYAARQAASQAQESATRAEANSLLAQSQAAESAAAAEALADGVVRYDSSQTLNASQKTQARTNIGAADASDTYTKAEVDAKVSSALIFKGSVATYDDLPTDGNVTGDMWNVLDTGANYAWTGEAWDKLSETIDLTPYLTKSDAANTYLKKTDNAVSSSKLQTSRRISATGDATWSVGFNGTQDESGTLTLSASGATAGSYGPSAAATLSFGGSFNVPYVTVDAKGRVTAIKHFALKLPAAQTDVSGNAETASKLETPRTIAISGAVTGTATSFDGSKNISIPTTAVDGTKVSVFGKATSSAAGTIGAVPAPAAGAQGKYLRGDGTWQNPPNTTYAVFKGATSSAAGGTGLVPAPAAGENDEYLRGDGTWQDPTSSCVKTSGNQTVGGTKTFNSTIKSSIDPTSWVNAANGQTIINSTLTDGEFVPLWQFETTDGDSFVLAGFQKNLQIAVVTSENKESGNNKSTMVFSLTPTGDLTIGGSVTADAFSGNATSASKLATARTFRTNLASTSTASFNGTANVTPGVTGTLPVGNGGTGRTDGKAVAWATARTISLGGDASGSVSVDGSQNVTLTATVKNSSTSDDAQGILQAFTDFANAHDL